MAQQPTRRYSTPNSAEQQCSVPSCEQQATYEVYLYDYYEHPGENIEFFEQDSTCPFICSDHMEENERKAHGRRVPRGIVRYPFTNQSGAQGYTKYQPMPEVFPTLFSAQPTSRLIAAYGQVNEELIRRIAKRPDLLHSLDPRRFEEIVAEIFADLGFSTELTPRTRDGGRDVLAVRSESFGSSLYLIECKRYDSTNKVGVEIVRGLAGVLLHDRATHAIVATTSTFTKGAIDFATPIKYQLSLKDYVDVTAWLKEFARKRGDV